MNKIQEIYKVLLKSFNQQGWWPLIDHKGSNPTKTGVTKGYHTGDYDLPKTEAQVFEICLGAILTHYFSFN